MKIELNFDPQEIHAEMQRMPWERVDRFTKERSVFLGNVFALTPSGKYYQPYACSNLAPCPVCEGSGRIRGGSKERTLRKWRNRSRRQRRLWIRRYGPAYENRWPKRIHRAVQHLNHLDARREAETFCARCDGVGSAEAADDARWMAQAEEALDQFGFSLEAGEGDPCDYYAVERCSILEPDDDEDEEVDP